MNESNLVSDYDERHAVNGESIILFESRKWCDYSFGGQFRFTSESYHEVEGGVILYLRYTSKHNNLSVHFCLNKRSVEIWQCVRGRWSRIGNEVPYSFDLNKQYSFEIRHDGELYSCAIDGRTVFCEADKVRRSGHVGLAAKYCSAVFSNICLCRLD
jgi:hypothetical protein